MTESISVFFPAYNDEMTIAALVSDALAVLPALTDDYEVLVVNDGSSDNTGVVLDELARKNPQVRVIHHETNRGYGGALRTGFTHATKGLIFYTDGDGQYDVRELASLHRLMSDEVDVVNGYKIERSDSWHRKALGAIYNQAVRFLFRIPIRDVDCDFRLIRRRAIERIELGSSSGSICVELAHKLHLAGCVFAETPVHHYQRVHGRSQFLTARRVGRTAFDLVSLWFKVATPSRRRTAA
jgi:glycosyltransferase involved in cell wall biosynthesis